MRKKEGLADYRYFPEPDLPEAIVSEEWLASVKVSRLQMCRTPQSIDSSLL